MKIFVFSDLHGNEQVMQQILIAIQREQPNKVVCCGDLLGGSGSVEQVANLFNQIDAVKYLIKGNNDGYYQTPLLDFEEYAVMYHFGRTLFFTHGHMYNGYRLPPIIGKGDVLVHGHTHRTHFYTNYSVQIVNVGSCSQPRDGQSCYAVLDNDGVSQKTLDGSTILQQKWN